MRIAVEEANALEDLISEDPSENPKSLSEKMKVRWIDSISESIRRTVVRRA
jgi:hypothetical protein